MNLIKIIIEYDCVHMHAKKKTVFLRRTFLSITKYCLWKILNYVAQWKQYGRVSECFVKHKKLCSDLVKKIYKK